jgi:PAS domain S-box-containing protein
VTESTDSATSPPPAERPTRVLVVEDEPIVALDLQLRLERMGYDVPVVASSGEDAVRSARAEPPDLVLMDINLEGEMDGIDAADELARERLPVVFLTAYSNDRTLQRAKIAEPYGYLLKPFEERELQTTIEVAVYKHQAQQALRLAHDQLEQRVAERTAELRSANEALRHEIAERERREERRLALARVREQVWRMQARADIRNVAEAVWASLETLGVPFHECGINVVEQGGAIVRAYDRVRTGAWCDLTKEDPRAAAAVLDMWRLGQVVYRHDLSAEDPFAETQPMQPIYGSVRCVLDVPFSHGTLAINSLEASAFDEDHISVLQELAEALSEGFRRLEDLQQLAAERERLSVTLQSIGDSVVATDADGRVILMNRVAETLSGWTRQEARGKLFGDVFRVLDEATRAPRADPVRHVLETGSGANLDLHTVLVSRDGTERPVATTSAPILDEEGSTVGVVLVSRDVGPQREMEEELLKAEKLESLGVLAGGIAHDFNNILTTIVGYLSLAKMEIEEASELYENLAEVESAADRATDLTHQLLAFAKGGAPVKKAASMAQIIHDSATFPMRGSNVLCELEIDPDLWPAEVDRGQISQVIQNLVINADQAMPAGGHMTVRAENLERGSADDGLPLEPGRYLRITVADDGVGIGEENLARIFDPYFTTKETGSGLGLATAFAIVRNHDGHMTVESAPGRGTRFDVYVPATTEPVEEIDGPAGEPLRGEGRLLVVDDEEAIRHLLADLLGRLGYEAECVADGREALEAYARARREGRGYRAVIMDLTIPGGMGGRETAQRLLEIDPEARPIVSSGYSDDPVMAHFRDHGFVGVVAKPYDVAEVSRVLARVLQRPVDGPAGKDTAAEGTQRPR